MDESTAATDISPEQPEAMLAEPSILPPDSSANSEHEPSRSPSASVGSHPSKHSSRKYARSRVTPSSASSVTTSTTTTTLNTHETGQALSWPTDTEFMQSLQHAQILQAIATALAAQHGLRFVTVVAAKQVAEALVCEEDDVVSGLLDSLRHHMTAEQAMALGFAQVQPDPHAVVKMFDTVFPAPPMPAELFGEPEPAPLVMDEFGGPRTLQIAHPMNPQMILNIPQSTVLQLLRRYVPPSLPADQLHSSLQMLLQSLDFDQSFRSVFVDLLVSHVEREENRNLEREEQIRLYSQRRLQLQHQQFLVFLEQQRIAHSRALESDRRQAEQTEAEIAEYQALREQQPRPPSPTLSKLDVQSSAPPAHPKKQRKRPVAADHAPQSSETPSAPGPTADAGAGDGTSKRAKGGAGNRRPKATMSLEKIFFFNGVPTYQQMLPRITSWLSRADGDIQPDAKKSYPIDAYAVRVMRLLVDRFRSMDAGGIFWLPVDRQAYPEYFEMITDPRDLALIERKVVASTKHGGEAKYSNWQEFSADVALIAANCMFFNAPASEIWLVARDFGHAALKLLHATHHSLLQRQTAPQALSSAVQRKRAKTRKQLESEAKAIAAASFVFVDESDKPLSERTGWDNIVINSYEEIDEYAPMADPTSVLEKLQSLKIGNCDGQHCHDAKLLGPYDPSGANSIVFRSECKDRRASMECSDRCQCDPANCANRGISLLQRKQVGVDVVPRRTYGMDSYTRDCIVRAMSLPPCGQLITDANKQHFIDHHLLPQINQLNPGNLQRFPHGNMLIVLRAILARAQTRKDTITEMLAKQLVDQLIAQHWKTIEQAAVAAASTLSLAGFKSKPMYEEWPIYPKGMGMVCVAQNGIKANELIAEYFGEVYPPWRWFEKEEVIKEHTRKTGLIPADDFYNIVLERHRDDPKGYDVLFVDPIRRGNFASRMSHSCNPNCSTVMMSAGGKYVIAMYATRDIAFSEELTFDYNSVTENEEEHLDSVCLCGTQYCRGSFLALAAADSYTQVLNVDHDFALRTAALLRVSLSPEPSVDDIAVLDQVGIRQSVLGDLPNWVIKYAAEVVRFIKQEETALPQILLAEALVKQQKAEALAAEVDSASKSRRRRKEGPAETDPAAIECEVKGLYHMRLQSLVIALDRVKYYLRLAGSQSASSTTMQVEHDKVDDESRDAQNQPSTRSESPPSSTSKPKLSNSVPQDINFSPVNEPPALRWLTDQEVVDLMWNNSDSVAQRFVVSMKPHISRENSKTLMDEFEVKLEGSQKGRRALKQNLLRFRDYCRRQSSSAGALHHAAADLLHLYAHTVGWFTNNSSYAPVKSPPFPLSELCLQAKPVAETKPQRPRAKPSSPSSPGVETMEQAGAAVEPAMEDVAPAAENPTSDELKVEIPADSGLEPSPAASPIAISSAGLTEASSAQDPLVEGRVYPPQYAWAALAFWFKQSMQNPTHTMANARRGVLSLPVLECCFAKNRQSSLARGYSAANRTELLQQLRNKPRAQWSHDGDKHWTFAGGNPRAVKMFGSPMFDQVMGTTMVSEYRKIIDEMSAWKVTFPSD